MTRKRSAGVVPDRSRRIVEEGEEHCRSGYDRAIGDEKRIGNWDFVKHAARIKRELMMVKPRRSRRGGIGR